MADPFDMLGLQPRFDLDVASIRRAHLRLVAATHPDSTAADSDKSDGGRTSALLNDAKRLLESPERRANALLARLGGPASDQDKSLPPGFLIQAMEMRERVEDALASRDPDVRAAIERDAAASRASHIERVGELFQAAGPHPSPPALREIRVELNAWRYIERLIEQLDPSYNPAQDLGNAETPP